MVLVINGLSNKNISFPFTYLAASLPAVLEVEPKTGSNAGGTYVRLAAEHIPLAQATPQALSVSFGGTAGTVVSVDCDAQGRECGIVVRTPAYSGFGSVSAALNVPTTNASSFAFRYFQPCDYKTHCLKQGGQIPNQALLGTAQGAGTWNGGHFALVWGAKPLPAFPTCPTCHWRNAPSRKMDHRCPSTPHPLV